MTLAPRGFLSLAFILALTACGGSSAAPTTPATTTNRAPVVSSVTADPPFGIQDKTQFSFSAAAADPDGDSLTYTWTIDGRSFTGSNASITFATGGALSASVTVSDGRGGTSNGSQTFMVGTLAGDWAGTAEGLGNFTMRLTQTNGEIAGTYTDLDGPAQVGPVNARGTIDAAGHVELPTDQGRGTVFTLRGTMDHSGRRITGGFFGSGFTGESVTMDKQ